MPFRAMFLVFVGGGIGAVLRLLAGVSLLSLRVGGFPLSTLVVNVVGAALAGIFAARIELGQTGLDARAFFVTGLLGGFTTFSAFSWEAITLCRDRGPGSALLYIVMSVALSVSACAMTFYAAARQ